MRYRFAWMFSLGVGLALASCADLVSPREAGGPDGIAPPDEFLEERDEIRIMRVARGAPPLEVSAVRVWVVQGVDRTVPVSYRGPTDDERFMTLAIPAATQLIRPDGTRLAPGDSVEVSATVDVSRLQVRFQPHGLVFAGAHPTLRLYWTHADPDVNGDGTVNRLDSEIVSTFLALAYRPDEGHAWSIPAGQRKSLDGRYVEIPLAHFSDYAVSWRR